MYFRTSAPPSNTSLTGSARQGVRPPAPLRAPYHLPGRPARAYDPQPPPGTTSLTGSARQGVRPTAPSAHRVGPTGVRPTAPSGHHITYRVGPTGRTTPAPPGTTSLTGSARQGVRPPSPVRAPRHLPGRPARGTTPTPSGTTPLTGSARQGVRPTAPSGHHITYRVGPPGRTTHSPLRAPHHLPGRPARAYDPQPPPGTTPHTGSARQGVRPTAPPGASHHIRVGPPGRTTHSPSGTTHIPGRPARAYDPQPPPGHHTTYRVGPPGRTTQPPRHHATYRVGRQGVRPTAPSGASHHVFPLFPLDTFLTPGELAKPSAPSGTMPLSGSHISDCDKYYPGPHSSLQHTPPDAHSWSIVQSGRPSAPLG